MSNPPHEAPALTAHEEHPGWRAFLNTRMLICVFLGFTSGLPLFTLVYLVQAWLRSEGVNLKEIGLFALIQFPYTWKFIWAPLMDRYVPRFPGWRPGRRRGWMLVTQILVAGAIGTLGFVSPKDSIWTVAALTALVAFFGASQDIVIDAYRRELLSDTQQGLGNAVHVNAYKIAALDMAGDLDGACRALAVLRRARPAFDPALIERLPFRDREWNARLRSAVERIAAAA